MEQDEISNEARLLIIRLLREKGIEYLFDLSIEAERILKAEIEKFTNEENRLPMLLPGFWEGFGIDKDLIAKDKEEHINFHRRYSGYEKVRSTRNKIQEFKQKKIEKEINHRLNNMRYQELLTLAYKKSECNFGYDLLSFLYFVVNELAVKHKVKLDLDEIIFVDTSGQDKTKFVLDQIIGSNARIGTLGLLKYILQKAIKEIEDENKARQILLSFDD